ncbi:LicD family protein [Pontibacter liquoris]|uniref:LicD family protein n=1 Tax=Pontibacter liquoris TaxID=2905677 RepID=UPI001FA79297|nr:LicD family protein [Pontibacter liquoris]
MDFEALFPDKREEGETRIAQCHMVLLRMFKIFDHLCRKHQIQYFLCSGTLKAAAIYKGFKPWDDDLDVGMTRENFEKFTLLAVPELPDDIFFQTPETDTYFPACHRVEAKLRDKYSSYSLPESMQQLKWHSGLMLDILVFDRAYLPNNLFIYLQNRLLIFFLQQKGNLSRARVQKWIARNVPLPLVYASSFINGRKMVRLGTNYFKASEIEEVAKAAFEGMEVPIPKGWHPYLQRRYGNYMQPPPAQKQMGHHSIGIPDPFTPCNHTEILHWKDRKKAKAMI